MGFGTQQTWVQVLALPFNVPGTPSQSRACSIS